MRLNLISYPFYVVRVFNDIVQTKNGSNMILQPMDNLFLNEEINYARVYDRFYDIKKDDIIIDIGAHVGIFTLRAARQAKNVLAIEPHPFNYSLLTNNVKANKLVNVQTLRLALWSSNGKMKLYLASSASHSLKPYLKDKSKYLEVQTKTLDTIIKELGIKRVNFIKIDVEGAELEVLRGAEETLKENDPFISIAAYHTSTEVHEITEYLQRKGFRVFVPESKCLQVFKSKGKIITTLRKHINMGRLFTDEL